MIFSPTERPCGDARCTWEPLSESWLHSQFCTMHDPETCVTCREHEAVRRERANEPL